MRRPHIKREPLTLEERWRDTRDAMEWRELCAVEIGARVADVDRPRRATLRRWLIADADFRERYAAVLDDYKLRVVEAAIEQADRDVEHARGRHRVAAMRRQVIARTQWLKLIEANAEREEEDAASVVARQSPTVASMSWPPTHPRVSGEVKETRGTSLFGEDDENRRIRSTTGTELPPAPNAVPLTSNDNAENDDAPAYAPEDARYRATFGEEAHASQRLPAPDTALAPANDDAEDAQLYAPEDARYRARQRNEGADAPSSPPASEPVAPSPPLVELDEDGEPRFHRLPLTVGEEEALKARLAGKPLPPARTKSPWKPDTPTYVRFDVGGGFDVSNRRDEETGWDSYDPFR